jgi:hypothetical protein
MGALALPLLNIGQIGSIAPATGGADRNAIRPTLGFEPVHAVISFGEVLNSILESLWFHGLASLTN